MTGRIARPSATIFLFATATFAIATIAAAAETPKFSPGEYNLAMTAQGRTHDTATLVEVTDGKVTIKKKSNPADAPIGGKLSATSSPPKWPTGKHQCNSKAS